MVLRPGRKTDVADLGDVAREAFGTYVPRMGVAPAPMSADYVALVAGGHVWVGLIADQIAGFVVLVPGGDHLSLEILAVRPALQGRGVGARLMLLAEEEAERQGLPAIMLCTNEAMTENLAFYASWGYREIRRAEHGGFRRVFFGKVLHPPPDPPAD